MRRGIDLSTPEHEMNTYSETKPTAGLLCGIFVLLGLSALTLRHIETLTTEHSKPDFMYVASPETVKRLSLGYTGLAADIYWTRAVQYFGWLHKQHADNYDLLYPLLDITTSLDPNLIVAYRFGANFLAPPPPNGAGQPDKAVALIKRGIDANPNEWRLFYEMGFVQAMEQRDYVAAALSFKQGSELPGAHPFMKVLAAAMAQHGGDVETARLMWTATFDSTDDPMVRSNASRHLVALRVDDDVNRLESVIDRFHQKTGVFPRSFLDLVSIGLLKRIPTDPLGHPYKLSPAGQVEVQDPEELPFISRGLPPGWKPRLQSIPAVKM